jgi:spore coat polysaccharide biosynthesis protein SpsF
MPPTAIIQARMSSRRLPGKSLRPVAGRPMLAYLIERLQHCRSLAGIVVATSTTSDDDAIAEFCAGFGVACHRGSLDDVLARFLALVDARALAAVVRVNGDSPLLDPELVDRAVGIFDTGSYDLVTNVAPRSFPRGQSVEVVSAAALRRLAMEDVTPEEREHVTLWFYRHPQCCAMRNFSAARDASEIQLSVDTPQDFAALAALVAAMDRPHWQYGLDELLELRRAALAEAMRR